MGSYGIGVSRLVGALIEANFDEKNEVMKWPASVSPFECAIICFASKNDTTSIEMGIKVKNFFNHLGATIEIKNEKSSINFWTVSGMMAPFYEILYSLSNWLVKKGIKKENAQKYISSLFFALSEDAFNHKKNLKKLVKDSQTPGGLNWQGVNQLRKKGFYKKIDLILNNIYKRLNKK